MENKEDKKYIKVSKNVLAGTAFLIVLLIATFVYGIASHNQYDERIRLEGYQKLEEQGNREYELRKTFEEINWQSNYTIDCLDGVRTRLLNACSLMKDTSGLTIRDANTCANAVEAIQYYNSCE